jgi:hypothetical protein
MRSTSPRFSRYLRQMGVLCVAMLAVCGTFVFAVDPLWMSPFDSKVARYYCVKNERQNKFDKARFDGAHYDAVTIGSSRANSFNFDRPGKPAFNFALGALFPFEYQPVLDFYAGARGEPQTVFLALDFYGAQVPTPETVGDEPPQRFSEQIADPFYRLRNTLSWNVLGYAINTVTNCKPKPGGYGIFDRQGHMLVERLPSMDHFERRAKANINFYSRARYGTTYVYNAELERVLAALRDSHPKSRFVVFITPESAPMWRLIIESGRFDDYGRWLREVVNVFGEVYDFIGYNSITTNYENFYDGHHVYADVGNLVVKRILGQPVTDHEDFGAKVTAANLAQHIERQRRIGPGDVSARELVSMQPFPAYLPIP